MFLPAIVSWYAARGADVAQRVGVADEREAAVAVGDRVARESGVAVHRSRRRWSGRR